MAAALIAVCEHLIINKSGLQETAAAEGMLSTEIQQQDAFAKVPGALDEEHYFCGSPHEQPTPLTNPLSEVAPRHKRKRPGLMQSTSTYSPDWIYECKPHTQTRVIASGQQHCSLVMLCSKFRSSAWPPTRISPAYFFSCFVASGAFL